MNPILSSVIPGSEIPRLLNHQDEDSMLRRSDASPFGHDCTAAVFCVVFGARCKMGTVSPMCPPKAKGKYNGSKNIPMVLDDDLAIMDKFSDYMWIVFLKYYEFIEFQNSLDDKIEALVGYDFDICVKKYGYRLIYDLDLELSNLTTMYAGNSSALKKERLAIEENK